MLDSVLRVVQVRIGNCNSFFLNTVIAIILIYFTLGNIVPGLCFYGRHTPLLATLDLWKMSGLPQGPLKVTPEIHSSDSQVISAFGSSGICTPWLDGFCVS